MPRRGGTRPLGALTADCGFAAGFLSSAFGDLFVIAFGEVDPPWPASRQRAGLTVIRF